jgi:hypothetical protein
VLLPTLLQVSHRELRDMFWGKHDQHDGHVHNVRA